MQKKWYTVEIEYNSMGEIKLFRVTNLDGATLKQFRENMFIGGVYRKIDETTGEILSPWEIKRTMVYRQAHFFGADMDNKPLVKS